MYFETIMHASRPVANADEAAQLIKAQEARDFDALIWTATSGRRLAVVADNHCDNSFLEVAVIDLDRKIQIESITAGWCKSPEELAKYFVKCETGDFFMRTDVTLPLDGKGQDTRATFECGCCGTGFDSTYEKQRRFDQDNGYGQCFECGDGYGLLCFFGTRDGYLTILDTCRTRIREGCTSRLELYGIASGKNLAAIRDDYRDAEIGELDDVIKWIEEANRDAPKVESAPVMGGGNS